MGLDIYLRKCADLDSAEAAEEAAEAEKEALWVAAGGYEKTTELQKAAIREQSEAIERKHGCTGGYGRHASIEELDDMPSKIDPGNMFKLGYFRSSYNEAGINSVMRRLGLPDLYGIFGANQDKRNVRPDWDASLVRVNEAIVGYEKHLAGPTGGVVVSEVRPMFEHGAQDQAAALALYADALQKNIGRGDSDFQSYSNRDGEFFIEGITVRAVITKAYKPGGDNPIERMLNRPAVFLVYDRETPEGKEDWYLTALRIVRESIEFVLAQPDKQHYYMVWSG